jgi:lambda repressor-like predicted transcriptional regulator
MSFNFTNEWIAVSSAIKNDRNHKWRQVEARVLADALKLNWIVIWKSRNNRLKTNKNI